MIERPPPENGPKLIQMPEDSDYWIASLGGNFVIGRRGEKTSLATLKSDPTNPDIYRKMRILLYVQQRAERERKGMIREEAESGGEVVNFQDYHDDLSRSGTFIMDANCYQAVALVENPEEKGYDDFSSMRDEPGNFEKISYEDFKKQCLTVGLPALAACINEKIYREYGSTMTKDHFFIVLAEDPDTRDLICFEKMSLNEPIRLTSLKKIFDRYPKTLWGVQKIEEPAQDE